MLFLLRALFGFALFAVFARMLQVAGPDPQTDGVSDAGYLALAVVLGIANAVVWAPWVGSLMADPLTGAFTTGHPGESRNPVLQLAHRVALRGWRRTALFFAFLEGVRNPDLPGAFVLGLNQARPGSWLEKVFAREVWRFDHAENCLRAWRILKARGRVPGLHRQAEVNLLILTADREPRPEPAVLTPVTAPPPAPPTRNPRIRLFTGAGTTAGGPGAAPGSAAPGNGAPAVEVAPGAEAVLAAEGGGFPTPAMPVPVRLTFRERLRVLVTGRLGD